MAALSTLLPGLHAVGRETDEVRKAFSCSGLVVVLSSRKLKQFCVEQCREVDSVSPSICCLK